MVTNVPMRFADVPLLWVVDDVYTPMECQNLIDTIERESPTLATNNPMFRNQDRVIKDDPKAAADLLERLRDHLPDRIGDLALLGVNERLRYYRYSQGQSFEPHMDHWYRANDTDISLLTILVYFNSDFEGGQTRFMEQVEQTVDPAAGRAAISQHKIRHEGCEVRSGRKYALRTDVMYRAATPYKLTYAE